MSFKEGWLKSDVDRAHERHNELADKDARIRELEDQRSTIDKICEHKWLDPQCIEAGCQSLVLRGQRNEAIEELTAALEVIDAERNARISELEAALETLLDAFDMKVNYRVAERKARAALQHTKTP